MLTRCMPLVSNGSGASPGAPGQPIQAPPAALITGSSAVTRPPGLARHSGVRSGPSVRSTGSRLAATTKWYRPGLAAEVPPLGGAAPAS